MSGPRRKEVCLVDTSILCEILMVPNLHSQAQAVRMQVQEHDRAGSTLMLPMATLLETGNHIAQNGDGSQRRQVATKFVQLVDAVLTDRGRPFALASFPDDKVLRAWLDVFPGYAQSSDKRGKGIGLADVSILDEWHRLRLLHPRNRVRIWSLDHHLSAHDHSPG